MNGSEKRAGFAVGVFVAIGPIASGPSAYSCLAQRADGMVLCLYERGEKSPYEKITVARFSTGWVK